MKRQTRRRHGPPGSGATRAAGMTLTELLVSAAILAMMIVCLSRMLVPAHKAVRLAQNRIKADANIRAVSTRLREDCSSIDTNGFLAIFVDHYEYGVDTTVSPPRPIYYPRYHLVMTTAGSFRSLCNGSVGANAARIHVGLSPRPDDRIDDNGTPTEEGDDTTYWILCRQAILLDPTCGQINVGDYYDADYEKSSAGWYHAHNLLDPSIGPIEELSRFLYTESAATPPYNLWLHPDGEGKAQFPVMVNTEQPRFKIRPDSVADIRALWPFLMSDIPMSAKVTGFKIQWTDGTTVEEEVGNVSRKVLKWYDKDNPQALNPYTDKPMWPDLKPSQFDARPVAAAGASWSEFSLGTDPNGLPIYCALWSPANRANWPKALRFLLTVGEKNDHYEIIVDMPN